MITVNGKNYDQTGLTPEQHFSQALISSVEAPEVVADGS